MAFTFVKGLTAIAVIGGAVGTVLAIDTGTFGSRAVPEQPPRSAEAEVPARGLPAGEQPAANPGQKGATYYWLEGQTRRVTTRFAEAIVNTERGPDGDLNTRLTDLQGNEAARLKIDRLDESNHVLEYAQQDSVLRAAGEANARPTLDWANHQAYTLWKDRTVSIDGLTWQHGLMRPKRSVKRDIDREIVELNTEWSGGLSAIAVRRTGVRHRLNSGRVLRGDVVVTRLKQNGAHVGTTNWFPQEQVFAWDLPGLTRGSLDAAKLAPLGGWRFTPDVAWVNLQTIAFHDFKTRIDRQRFVSRARSGPLEKIAHFFVTPVAANEPGCDGLHWIDGTVFRFCCDRHDYCYAKAGCTWQSWWRVWSSWTCDMCNGGAVLCVGGMLDGPMYQI